jgi:hypothetical protein
MLCIWSTQLRYLKLYYILTSVSEDMFTLEMEVAPCSQTLVTTYQTSQHLIPQHHNVNFLSL